MVCYVSLTTRDMYSGFIENEHAEKRDYLYYPYQRARVQCPFCNLPLLKGEWRVQIGSYYLTKRWAHLKCMLDIPKKKRPKAVENDFDGKVDLKVDWKTIDAFAGVLKP